MKGLVIHSFVIMTSHIHLIVSVKDGGEPLPGIIRDFKKYTSVKLIQAIKTIPESRRIWLLRAFKKAGTANPNNTRNQVWQQDNHPIELITLKFVRQKLEYIHLNPVKAGIVFQPTDYVQSSATAYAGRDIECPLEIVLFILRWVWVVPETVLVLNFTIFFKYGQF